MLEPTFSAPGGEVYLYCGRRLSEGHDPTCNLASVPQIIAVLEAVQGLSAEYTGGVGLRDLLTRLDAVSVLMNDNE